MPTPMPTPLSALVSLYFDSEVLVDAPETYNDGIAVALAVAMPSLIRRIQSIDWIGRRRLLDIVVVATVSFRAGDADLSTFRDAVRSGAITAALNATDPILAAAFLADLTANVGATSSPSSFPTINPSSVEPSSSYPSAFPTTTPTLPISSSSSSSKKKKNNGTDGALIAGIVVIVVLVVIAGLVYHVGTTRICPRRKEPLPPKDNSDSRPNDSRDSILSDDPRNWYDDASVETVQSSENFEETNPMMTRQVLNDDDSDDESDGGHIVANDVVRDSSCCSCASSDPTSYAHDPTSSEKHYVIESEFI